MRLFNAFARGNYVNAFEQLGGAPAVDHVVEVFSLKVLKDTRINKYYDGVDMEKQIGKQKAFLTMAFGGPNSYSGLDMRKAHAKFVEDGLTDTHFDASLASLTSSLQESSVSDVLICAG